jgi:glycosyltransferase involved in cell wall biosynthesis
MNIGFDAKRIYNNNTGLGHYSRTLVTSLAQFFPAHQYHLYTPRLSDMFDAKALPNLHPHVPSGFINQAFKSLWRSKNVVGDLVKDKMDLFHGLSHEIPVGIQDTKVKSVVTMHDLIFERYPNQYKKIDIAIYRKKFKNACQHANKVIAISQQTKADLIDFYKVPTEKISICYQSCNPIFGEIVKNEEKERVRLQYNLPKHYLLYLGSIIERKNLLQICQAIHQLGTKCTIPLVVIGSGDAYMQKVQQYIAQNNLQAQIIFLSENAAAKESFRFRTALDFPAIYQMASCLIYPSIFEGFGIPVLEALWSRVPVITSNVSCMPETGGDAALYVDPTNDEQMAEAILTILNDPQKTTEMIAKGWAHAQTFTQEKCAAEVMKTYNLIMNYEL